jgi:hypothetical protein
MPHAIIRGRNGRRHEVDFGDEPVRVEISSSEETVEIFIEADFDAMPEERRRFALLNIPRHLFSEATAATARRAANPVLHRRRDEWCRDRGLIPRSARFPVLVMPQDDLLTAANRGVSRPSRTLTGPPKHPHAFPRRDSAIDGTMRRPVAAVEARRSRPPQAWPVDCHHSEVDPVCATAGAAS